MFYNICSKMFNLLILLYFLFISGSLFSILFPNYYFSELVLSFLPYTIALSFLGLILSILFFIKSSKNYKKILYQRPIFALIILLSAIMFLFWSRKFNNFYNIPVNQIKAEMTGWLKILYANIYKNNQDYTGIQNIIKKENPDILFFVEFADHHYSFMKDFLNKDYPYSNSTRWNKKYVWNMVFSKIKIENRADDFPQWAWRYAYFSVNYQKSPVYFYLVHMSSPVSLKYFYMRNEQINTFFKDFKMHQETHRVYHNKVVALWDFNTSPWSTFYWNFAQWFEWDFINVTRYFPIIFTWKSFGLPIFWSHIDHIFVNKSVSMRDIKLVTIPWSDHKWFVFYIK